MTCKICFIAVAVGILLGSATKLPASEKTLALEFVAKGLSMSFPAALSNEGSNGPPIRIFMSEATGIVEEKLQLFADYVTGSTVLNAKNTASNKLIPVNFAGYKLAIVSDQIHLQEKVSGYWNDGTFSSASATFVTNGLFLKRPSMRTSTFQIKAQNGQINSLKENNTDSIFPFDAKFETNVQFRTQLP